MLLATSLLGFLLSSGATAIPVSEISSPTIDWTTYPAQDVIATNPKAAWVATYQAAKAKGLIPALPPSTAVGGNVVYPVGAGVKCSWTLTQCFDAEDIHQAPTGIIGLSFDDGPTEAAPALLQYLRSQNLSATHFVIGSRIVDNPQAILAAVAQGEHLAGHTWSHPYMTSLTDLQVIAEIGYGLQAIFDLTGLSPLYFRFPYGDADERTRAIARQVFGLTIVFWNDDTNDWCIGTNECGTDPVNAGILDGELHKFYNQPKNPGLIILEHELNTNTIGGFMRNYPYALAQGWAAQPIPEVLGAAWYHNAITANSPISKGSIGVGNTTLPSSLPTLSTSSPLPTATNSTSGLATTATAPGTVSTAAPIVRVSAGEGLRVEVGLLGLSILLLVGSWIF